MRILHTSDWHLGQHFMGKTRQAEHQEFCAWLLAQIEQHQVDAVLIAGDVFDTGSPPSYAREQYNRLVVDLHMAGCALVVLAGNHDSPAMLGESRSLLAELGARVVPGVAADPREQVIELKTRQGEVGAILCAIPFLRARELLVSQAGESAQDKQLALQQAIAAHYQELFERAQLLRAERALPIIATGHLTTVGAKSSESVREIYVGSLEAFPTNAFPPADYIALGHIHRPQKVGGLEQIRYCGSPIALSFDEASQQKELLLVEFAGGALVQITPLAVPVFQTLVSVQGSLAELKTVIAEAAKQGSAQKPVWLDVQVQHDDYLSDLQGQVNQLCEGLPVEVLRLRRSRVQSAMLTVEARETLDELTPADVFSRRLAQEALAPEHSAKLQTLYSQVLEELGSEAGV